MKKGLKKGWIWIFLLLFVVFLPVQTQAQKKKVKKDRWELEASFGQFWIRKHKMPDSFEKTYNPDFQAAFRLRIWRGFYIGVVAGMKEEFQNEYWITDLYTNYFELENRFGDFVAKDYTERYLSTFKMAPYIGAESKINLFTLKLFKKKVGITPFGKIGVKKWFSQDDGFFSTTDYLLYDSGVPYLIYHAEWRYTGNYTYHATQTWWHVNPDGSKGEVYYSEDLSGGMNIEKPGIIVNYGGGISFRIKDISLSLEVQEEKRRDNLIFQNQVYGHRTFWHLMWRVGLAYRF